MPTLDKSWFHVNVVKNVHYLFPTVVIQLLQLHSLAPSLL